MSKLLFILFLLSSVGFAESSSDGSFSVHHLQKVNLSLHTRTDTRNRKYLSQRVPGSATRVSQRRSEPCPHFTVHIGAERNELHSRRTQDGQIWMKKWDPIVFSQGVVVLTFDQMLTRDVIVELGNRVVQQSNAVIDVAGLK
jgi:hypothetical protein